MLAIYLLFSAICFFAIKVYISTRKTRICFSKIKSVPSLPFIGHALKFGFNNDNFIPVLEKMWIDTGRDKFLLKIGPVTHVVLTNPEDVETILVSQRLLDKNDFYKNLSGLMGFGLLTVEPSKWHTMRRILTPAFYVRVLESHTDIYETQAKRIIKDITANPTEDVELMKIFFKRILATLTTAGIGLDVSVSEDLEYLTIMTELIAMTNAKILSAWKSIQFLYDLSPEGKDYKKKLNWLYNRNREVLTKKREKLRGFIDELSAGKSSLEDISDDEDFCKKRLSIIDLLILGKNSDDLPYSNEEIIVEVLTFTVAGMETTSSAASFTMYNLATHPDIQKLVVEEQLSLTDGDLTRPVTFKDVRGMKYLEAVIKETLRLYCPVVMFGRKTIKNVVLTDGTEIPSGVNISLFPFLSQRHPDVFVNPEKFDPSRFIGNTTRPYTFYPFGAGPRDCIGKVFAMLLIKYYIASLIRSLELLPPKGETPKLIMELGLKSSTGVNIRWRKR